MWSIGHSFRWTRWPAAIQDDQQDSQPAATQNDFDEGRPAAARAVPGSTSDVQVLEEWPAGDEEEDDDTNDDMPSWRINYDPRVSPGMTYTEWEAAGMHDH